MRLDELIGYDALRDTGQRDNRTVKTRKKNLLDKLFSMGFAPLANASGAFATVLSHPNYPYVIKIFRNDPCYLAFVKMAIAHKDNPYFPRFFGQPLSLPTDKELFGIRMEWLSPLESRHRSFIKMIQTLLEEPGEEPVTPETSSSGMAWWRANERRHANERSEIEKMHPEMAQACALIRNIMGDRCREDMHAGNLMQRGAQQVVITDPLATKDLIRVKDTKGFSRSYSDVDADNPELTK